MDGHEILNRKALKSQITTNDVEFEQGNGKFNPPRSFVLFLEYLCAQIDKNFGLIGEFMGIVLLIICDCVKRNFINFYNNLFTVLKLNEFMGVLGQRTRCEWGSQRRRGTCRGGGPA
jgi:hypothetical protein